MRLREGRDITLVDTGPPGSADRIAALLDGWGRVRQVVLTHHADHAGSAREVSAWPGVRVAAHHADARVVRGEARGEWPDFTPAERDLHAVVGAGLPDPPDVPQARVDLDLDDGDVLDGGLQVVRTPGHTPGSIALRHQERGLLFTGDTAAEREGAVFLGPFNIDRERARQSFRRLGHPAVTTVCFGHGDPLVGERTGLLRAVASAARVPDPLGWSAPPTAH
jgi:glyoxylase-like metal-dependent hydrolase (beta-lactamase superfamily II)